MSNVPGSYLELMDNLEKTIYSGVELVFVPTEGFTKEAKLLMNEFGIASAKRAALQKIDDLTKIVNCGSPGNQTYPEIQDREKRLLVYLETTRMVIESISK